MGSNSHLTGITWRTSSYSGDTGGSCVEIAEVPSSTVAVRDSKNPTGPILILRPAASLSWTTTERPR